MEDFGRKIPKYEELEARREHELAKRFLCEIRLRDEFVTEKRRIAEKE